jgi:hypothetical protein
MSMRRPWRSAAQWEELVGEFDGSNETQREFCERKGLGVSTFRKWRQRESASRGPGPAFKEVGFVELTPGMATPSGITLHVGQALRIECPQGMSVESIAKLARSIVDGR